MLLLTRYKWLPPAVLNAKVDWAKGSRRWTSCSSTRTPTSMTHSTATGFHTPVRLRGSWKTRAFLYRTSSRSVPASCNQLAKPTGRWFCTAHRLSCSWAASPSPFPFHTLACSVVTYPAVQCCVVRGGAGCALLLPVLRAQVGIRTLNAHQHEQAQRFGVTMLTMDKFSRFAASDKMDTFFKFENPLYVCRPASLGLHRTLT